MTFETEIKRVAVEETVVVEIFIGGDINQGKHRLSQLASQNGACWSVEPTEFIYTGGREVGMIVRSINYPRFPSTVDKLMEDAILIAQELMYHLGQGSCSVVGPKETVWLTRRKDD
jgi:hypothetical protein